LKTYSYGGLDALSIMRGNYNGLTESVPGLGTASGYNVGTAISWGPSGSIQNAVLSQYAYRDVPFWPFPNITGGQVLAGGPFTCMRLDYVSPALVFTNPDIMGPLFKTQKILGGRALAADAFGKNACENATWAGPGYYAHRDGYNVLYGDWSAHWWGDPLQKFIWWAASIQYAIDGGDTNVPTDVMYGTTIAGTSGTAATSSEASGYGNGCVIQWHMLDLANGIDNLPTP
jgi:hypothetical protein